MAKNDDQDIIDELLKQLGAPPDISEGMAMAITDDNEWIAFENAEQAWQWHNEQVEKKIEKTEEMFKGEGRVVIRASGTEPLIRVMIEGKDQKVIDEKANEIAKAISDM